MYAQTAVQAGAGEAEEYPEFWAGPLRGGGGAVAAGCVSGAFLEGEELGFGFWVDFPHFGGLLHVNFRWDRVARHSGFMSFLIGVGVEKVPPELRNGYNYNADSDI